jgi:hypothetical protein
MTKNVDSDGSALVGGRPDEIVILKAVGRHTRMAKEITITDSGAYGVSSHDGRRVYFMELARTVRLPDVFQAGRALSNLAPDEFVIRGALVAGLSRRFRRILISKRDVDVTIVSVARLYIIFDIEGVMYFSRSGH